MIEELRKVLDSKEFVFTREPYTFSGGVLDLKYPMQRLFRFAEDQVVHYEEVLKPAFEARMNVVSDRVASVSSLIYRQYEGVDCCISKTVHGFLPRPDVIIIIDVTAEELFKRAEKKSEEHYSLARASILRKLYFEYAMSRGPLGRSTGMFIVDGNKSITDVAIDVENIIRTFLK